MNAQNIDKKPTVKKETKNIIKADIRYIWHRFITRFTFSTFKTFLQFIDANNKLKETIKAPLLVVRGELDELVPKETVETILNSCVNPVKEYVGIPTSSHLILRFCDNDYTINKINVLNVSAPNSLITSSGLTTFPLDLLIFSPSEPNINPCAVRFA